MLGAWVRLTSTSTSWWLDALGMGSSLELGFDGFVADFTVVLELAAVVVGVLDCGDGGFGSGVFLYDLEEEVWGDDAADVLLVFRAHGL